MSTRGPADQPSLKLLIAIAILFAGLCNFGVNLSGQGFGFRDPVADAFAASYTSESSRDQPTLTTIRPSAGQQGQQNLSVVITGQNTHFQQGKTRADFGVGIHVDSLIVNSATSSTAVVNIDLEAKTGPRDVTLSTDQDKNRGYQANKGSSEKPECETATLRIGFTVTPAPAPLLIQVNPNIGQPAQLGLPITLTGQYTHFKQGKTSADFGPGIKVVALKVNSSTSALAVLNIDPAAAIGPRDVAVSTEADSEQERASSPKSDCIAKDEKIFLKNGFTVIGGQNPVLLPLRPNTGQQGQQSLPIAITGQGTHFSKGVTTANFGPGITIVSVNVNSATSASAIVNIDPSANLGGRNVTLTTGSEVAALSNGFAVTAGSPLLALVNPSTGQQGQQSISVSITGQFTHFAQGTTTASFGSGITIVSLTVKSATSLTAVINIDPTASTGARNVTLTTNAELVTLSQGFSVTTGTPSLTLLNPNSGQQGQQGLSVTISGQFTHFAQGITTATFGSGVAVVSVTVSSPTIAMAVINIDPAAATGTRNVTLTSNTEVVALANSFTVTAGNPVLTQSSPNMGQQNQKNLSVTITGQYTHFSQGITTASFGLGITVVSVTVTSATSLAAVINIDSAATTGPRNVTLTTNAELVTLANSFTVTPGTPVLTMLNPNAGQQGQSNLSVSLTGQFTHWVQGTTTASFGSGITVNSLTVISATNATAVISISSTATAGINTVTVTTGSEIVTLTNAFTVTSGTPVLTQVSPNTGQQGKSNLSVSLTGQFTHWVQGTTTASFGIGITVNSFLVNSPTSATAVISISSTATVGTNTVTVTTGSEVVTLTNGFTVTSGTPVLNQVSPNTGQQAQSNLSVSLTGQFTHWVQGTTTASFGTGITVNSLTVNSATSASAVISIGSTATAGTNTVTVTTGSKVVTLTNGFTVTSGVPVLTQVSPSTGQQGQSNLSISLTGQFTHWVQGTTTASFGAGITVNSLTVNSSTSATAVISIGSTASAGASNVTATTGSETVSLTNGFTVLGGQVTLSVQPPTSPSFDSSQTISGGFANGTGQTTIAVAGGASAVSQAYPTGQSQFGLDVPLRPNAENLLTVTATDSSGQTASASNLRIVQVTLSTIVKAQVTAQRLSTSQVEALVNNGTISLSNPANFNVSMFAVSLSIGGGTQTPPVTLSVPVIEAVGQNFAIGPPVTLQCQTSASDDDIGQDGNTILVPCGTQPTAIGPLSVSSPKVVLRPVLVDVPGTSESIPGILVIDGTIKTLKEFFNVGLVLMNTSSAFTLSGISAEINIPDNGLSPVVPAGGSISINDLAANTQGSGQFVIRGDVIGTHTVTVNFGALVGGPLLTTPIPISGSASTDVQVEGPPTLNVTVEQPGSVNAGVPYTLKVNIANTSTDLDALYGSLQLNLGGASLIDPATGLPTTGSNIASLGNILAGQSESLSYTVIPNDTGPITSCVGAASENITLSVVITNSGLGCATGTLQSQTLAPSGQPTVAVLPAPNTVNVSVNAPITLLFSDEIQTGTITTSGPGAAFALIDPSGATVPGVLQFTTLPNGATVAVYQPAAPLKSTSVYQVTVSQGIYDASGMQLASGITESFTTAPPPPADTTPPVVSIQVLPPVDPASIQQGQLAQVLVNATDDSGVVSRVDLLLDGQLIDSRVPQSALTFLLDTSALDPGSSHALTAVATDPSNNTSQTSLNITISADATPPTVAISAPASVLVGQMLQVGIQASDNVRVARVDLFIDGGASPVYTSFIGPYQTSLDTTILGSGQHQLVAVATDGAGNTAQAMASVSVKSVTVISLSPGSITFNATGTTQALSVIGTLSDGTTTPIVSGVMFSSSNPSVATVGSDGTVTDITPGTAAITAAYGPLPPAKATVTDVAATPTTLTLVSGNNQTGTTGQVLASPLVVQVTDATSHPVPNVGVTFSVVTGSGTVGQTLVATNTQGQSSTTLLLGQTPGAISVSASAGSLPPVTFNETGTAPKQAPTLANPGNQTSAESATASLALVGNDPNGDALVYSTVGLPASLVLNSATGLISGTIGVSAGTYPVTVTATDGSLSASQSFTWTVTAPQTSFVDVSVAMSATPNPDPAGVSLTYTLSVSNLGTAQATGVVVRDTLPPGTVFLSASQGCANTAGTVICNIGTLAPAHTSPVTIAIAAFAAGQVTNSATATLNETDSAPANNTATLAANVVLSPLGPGLSPTNAADIFDPSGLTWASTGGMTIPRAGTTLTVLGDGTVLVLGGVSAATDVYTPVASGETFDPSTGSWTPSTAPLSAPRAFHTATLLPNGSVLVVGGLDASGNPLATAEIYQGPPMQQTTPVLTWPTPAAIAHGTPLSGAQLNATPSVPGKFTYSPPGGTVLAAGSQTLSVLFTPTDTLHYTTSTATVILTVTP